MKLSRRIEDQILLLKIKHGDQEAFAIIYDKYVDALFRFVVFRVRSEEIAQDITSELFLKIWQHITTSPTNVENLRAFLYQMARNLVADHYRTTQETLPLEEAIEVEGSGAKDLNVRLSLAEVEKGLSNLPGDYIEGFKHAEIAAIIGKSPAATRVLLHRAIKELKRILNQATN
ncbi:MAG: RNA polymerase sigma-H factor [Parcubacteria group bacterium GW2011_GWD2_43_10]|nr:MAG: RNA polymerase sigma-H factor [Parcubacteria group bacterium GW2011_GWD2_43_10]